MASSIFVASCALLTAFVLGLSGHSFRSLVRLKSSKHSFRQSLFRYYFAQY